MPTIFSHAAVGSGLARFTPDSPPKLRRHATLAAAVLAMLPDADAVAFRLGIPYASPFGHRGITHSLVFAGLAAIAATGLLAARSGRSAWRATPFLFAAAASHPLLDMLTNGGLGCALLAPFTWERLFFPWRPIPVSPIGVSARLGYVLKWELVLLWPPAIAGWMAARWLRGRRGEIASSLRSSQ